MGRCGKKQGNVEIFTVVWVKKAWRININCYDNDNRYPCRFSISL